MNFKIKTLFDAQDANNKMSVNRIFEKDFMVTSIDIIKVTNPPRIGLLKLKTPGADFRGLVIFCKNEVL